MNASVMAAEIFESDIPSFLERFYHCCDARVLSVSLRFTDGLRMVTVSLEAMDRDALDGWSNLQLEFLQLVDFQVREGKTTCQVVSVHGLQIVFEGGVFGAAFDSTFEAATLDDIRRADFFAVSKRLQFDVLN